MFIPKGSNKHKERPRLKSFSGEVLLCRWFMNKKEERPFWGTPQCVWRAKKIVRKSFGKAEKAHDEWFPQKKVIEKFGNLKTSVLSL